MYSNFKGYIYYFIKNRFLMRFLFYEDIRQRIVNNTRIIQVYFKGTSYIYCIISYIKGFYSSPLDI